MPRRLGIAMGALETVETDDLAIVFDRFFDSFMRIPHNFGNGVRLVYDGEPIQESYQDGSSYRLSDTDSRKLASILKETGVIPDESSVHKIEVAITTSRIGGADCSMVHISGDLILNPRVCYVSTEHTEHDASFLLCSFSYNLGRSKSVFTGGDVFSLSGNVWYPGQEVPTSLSLAAAYSFQADRSKIVGILDRCSVSIRRRAKSNLLCQGDVALIQAIKTMLEAIKVPE
ncbi:MAG: hypothetical protein U9Q67_00505 [Patescibacteria group bacterium]|nr:hypothetical protein [Patescibacteria group bacterium]